MTVKAPPMGAKSAGPSPRTFIKLEYLSLFIKLEYLSLCWPRAEGGFFAHRLFFTLAVFSSFFVAAGYSRPLSKGGSEKKKGYKKEAKKGDASFS